MSKKIPPLSETHPELAKQWHPTKNGELTPDNITSASHRKVWWWYPYDDPKTGKHFDFEWKTSVLVRTRYHAGCPYLYGKYAWPGFNDLQTTHPELCKEWHPTKNGDLKPTNVSASSEKMIWWLYSYDDPKTGKHFDFEWQSNVDNRARLGKKCPYISSRALWVGFNDLVTTHPDIAAEWHPTKNGMLKPSDVMPGYNKKVWWYLPYDDVRTGKHFDFEWQMSVNARTSKKYGCPYLSGQKVHPEFNSLAALYPELAKEWHPTKNGTLKPTEVASGTTKKAWWMIEHKDEETGRIFVFEWEAPISKRALENHGCPYLSNQLVHPEFNSLATKMPELAAEWHPTKNGSLKPTEVTCFANKKVWWRIEVDGKVYEWEAKISKRAIGQTHPALSQSRLEKIISTILENNHVIYTREKMFADCRQKRKLRYDFLLESENILIECDGQQHFEDSDYFKTDCRFDKQIEHDNIKNQYTSTHQIPLLRIPYIYDTAKGRPKIEQFVLEFIQTKQVPQEILNYYKQFKFSNYIECVQYI